MKIHDWERTDFPNGKIVWRHITGIRIVLVDTGSEYQLYLLDKAGREKYRAEDTNRSVLEHTSTDWQRDYNNYLEKRRN